MLLQLGRWSRRYGQRTCQINAKKLQAKTLVHALLCETKISNCTYAEMHATAMYHAIKQHTSVRAKPLFVSPVPLEEVAFASKAGCSQLFFSTLASISFPGGSSAITVLEDGGASTAAVSRRTAFASARCRTKSGIPCMTCVRREGKRTEPETNAASGERSR